MSESKDPMTPAERAQFDKDIRLVRDNKPKGFRDTLIHAGNCVGADLVIIHSTRRLYSVVSIEPAAINQEYCASNNQVITAPTTSGMCVEIVRAIRRMEATMKAVNARMAAERESVSGPTAAQADNIFGKDHYSKRP